MRGNQKVHRGPHHQDLLRPRGDGEGEGVLEQAQSHPGGHPQEGVAQELGVFHPGHYR